MTQAPRFGLSADVVARVVRDLSKHGVRDLKSVPYDFVWSEYGGEIREAIAVSGALLELEGADGTGIVYFDVDLSACEDQKLKMAAGAALFDLANRAVFNPVSDKRNGVTFSIYASSAENADQMKTAGIRFYRPDEKLGFHNDVLHAAGKYFVPKYISLLNLFIGYSSPGNFLYLHKKFWSEGISFLKEAEGRRFRFRPTPVVYSSDIANLNKDIDWSLVPIAWTDVDGQSFYFCNGELVDHEGEDLIERFRNSLLRERRRITVSQEVFRIVMLRNDMGFHSRDIFQDQTVFSGVTRLMLRSVSTEAVEVP